MADRSAEFWYPTAAYLYVLHLDGPALSWEYLRRNPEYRLDWLAVVADPRQHINGACACWKIPRWTHAMRIRSGCLRITM